MDKIKQAIAKPLISIKNALKQMDSTGRKIIIVVDNNNRLLGVVTDGDIRRWILKGKSLSASISHVMNVNPFVLEESDMKLQEKAKKIMLTNEIECLPIINANKQVISGIWWVDLFENNLIKKKSFNLPIVIMAGGEGTRLAPFTKILPKPLIPVGEKAIVERIIDKFAEYGCKNYYLSVNYKSNMIKAYFNDFNHSYNLHYIQEDKPLGTAGSLQLLKNKIKSTFFVSNCDILIEADYADILKSHRKYKNKITLVSSMKHYTIPYGVCNVGKKGELKKIIEKPEYDFLVNTGMYIIEPEILELIPSKEVFHITQLISILLKRGIRVGVYPISEKSWLDMGQFEELKEMLKKFGV